MALSRLLGALRTHHPAGCRRGRAPAWSRKVSIDFIETDCRHCWQVIHNHGVRPIPEIPVLTLEPDGRITCPRCGTQVRRPADYPHTGPFLLVPSPCDCWPAIRLREAP